MSLNVISHTLFLCPKDQPLHTKIALHAETCGQGVAAYRKPGLSNCPYV